MTWLLLALSLSAQAQEVGRSTGTDIPIEDQTQINTRVDLAEIKSGRSTYPEAPLFRKGICIGSRSTCQTSVASTTTYSIVDSSCTFVPPGNVTQTSAKVRFATVTFTTDGVSPLQVCFTGNMNQAATPSSAMSWNFWIDGALYTGFSATNGGIYCPHTANGYIGNCTACVPIWGPNLPAQGSHNFSWAPFDPQNFQVTWPGSYVGGSMKNTFCVRKN